VRTARPELDRHRSEIVLFAGQNHRPIITLCSSEAGRLGLHIGQPLAEAKTLLPDAVFLPADGDADRDALCQLAIECQRFSPLVGLEEAPLPECLLCEATGCTHLWGGEERFLEAIRNYWRKRGYHIQLALAGTVGAAWALAHAATVSLVKTGDEEAALSSLSVVMLRLPSAVLERLEALGLWTISDVLRLPRETLASRFGAILPERLDQALGFLSETFVCEQLEEALATFREWEVPIDDRGALAFVCRKMLRDLLAMAKRQGMGIQELEGKLHTTTETTIATEPVTIAIRLVEPTQEEEHLAQLVELQLERQTWSGGVVAVRFTALRLGRLEQVQGCWFDDEPQTRSSRAFNALVDRLSSRLETTAVLRAEVIADSQPEHTVRLVPWTSEGRSEKEPKARPSLPRRAGAPVGSLRVPAGPRPPAGEPRPPKEPFTLDPEQSRGRPIRLLGTPQPIDVSSVVPDGPPFRTMWQRQDCLVVRAWGPERIATGWWRAEDVQRDYYRVEWDDGTQVWVYRDQRTGRWFLHGFFD
jgi:protein ImuB